MTKKKMLTLALLFLQVPLLFSQSIGRWSWSSAGLPIYEYSGHLPFAAVDKTGNDAMLPTDPYFLLGNYKMALVCHASGIFQLLTAERAWARVNAATQTNYGWNQARIIDNTSGIEKTTLLTGLQSDVATDQTTKKSFGVGFARYNYALDNKLVCTRIISVKPSPEINTGNPALVLTVMLKNNDRVTKQVSYSERMLVNFVQNATQYTNKPDRPLEYSAQVSTNPDKTIAVATISYKTSRLLVVPKKTERFPYDVAPPSIFMSTKNHGQETPSMVTASGDTLATTINLTIKPGETKMFNIVIGLSDGNEFSTLQNQVDQLFEGADLTHPEEGLFAKKWKSALPDLSGEKNEILRREMLWNAHFIEASAKYSSYYEETFIPQGTVYSYYFGDNISNRDHLQAALPACYTNPKLAKSIIRYVIKHTDVDGEIKRGNSGFGYTAPSQYKESDEQLYFFNTLAEYLLITKDYPFLNEMVSHYPAENKQQEAVITILKKHFIYLRDEVGFGANGLVRMLNSDWSDSFFHDYSPNRYLSSAESHVNSAMALAVIPKLITVLELAKNNEATSLIKALEQYYTTLEKAYMKDFADRKFSARAYLNAQLRFGVDNVCIEPQSYLLQIPSLSVERKKEIYEYVKRKLLTPEKIGIRTREKPLWKGKPEGEDGGIWFSLEYPLLLGVASFDKAEAQALLLKFSFNNFAMTYPDYWVGHWTAADEVNSTLYREGLYSFWVPSKDHKNAFQGFCSHPHTWPLFCYFKLQDR